MLQSVNIYIYTKIHDLIKSTKYQDQNQDINQDQNQDNYQDQNQDQNQEIMKKYQDDLS